MEIILEASDEDEAKDLAYEIGSSFTNQKPGIEFAVEKVLIKRREYKALDKIEIEVKDVEYEHDRPRRA